ncbi:diacylglycerol/polyprenol kinase family protein [Treponema parvum]|uniref:diacylglycerol/polyprenol kinase family protein n=1 Tax=Treponema parvum TaxID=138851 RepID=UPI001AEC21BB|nr:phosphatidate cytidylyltransferase [Treponema parvum]QTQ15731.1 phosphatidate cytidylyltransferase [Treponema parvum]
MSDRISGILIKQHIIDLKKEVFRKSIHICAGFVPFFLAKAYVLTIVFLCLSLTLYLIFESMRIRGCEIPLVSAITAAAARKRDENKFVLGPVTLVLGIIACALLWERVPAAVGIYALAFGDGLASLVGKLMGSIKIPFTRGKTVAGSLACFIAIFCSTFLVLRSVKVAFFIAVFGMLIEILPLKNLDNLVIPVVLGGIAQFIIVNQFF